MENDRKKNKTFEAKPFFFLLHFFIITFQRIVSSFRIIFDYLIRFNVFFEGFEWIITILMPLPAAKFFRIIQVLVHGQTLDNTINMLVWCKQLQNDSFIVNLFTSVWIALIIFYAGRIKDIEKFAFRLPFCNLLCFLDQPAFVTENGFTQLIGMSKYRAQKLICALCSSSGVWLLLTNSTTESSLKRNCQFCGFSKSQWTLSTPPSLLGSCKFTWNFIFCFILLD